MNPGNVAKLRAICEAFGISVTAVAVAARTSRPTASRILHGSMTASNAFWKNLEQNLSELLKARTGQVFDIPAVDVEKVEQLLKVG